MDKHMGVSMKEKFTSHTSAHQKASTVEEELNSQVHKMMQQVGRQPHFTISQSRTDTMGHSVRDGDYSQAQKHGILLNKAFIAATGSEGPVFQRKRPMLRPQYGTISPCWVRYLLEETSVLSYKDRNLF